MTEPLSRDWKTIVADSNGSLVHIPEQFIAPIKEWKEKKAAFDKRVQEMAAIENEMSNLMQNTLYNMRKFFAENGRPEVWTKDFGLEMNALEDGEFLVGITQPRGM